MKKPTDNKDLTNANQDSNSDNNVGDIINERGDEFVLFPLDVKETNPITQNTTTSQDDDFILFPLDVKKTSTNTNNSVPITNQKTNKLKRQYVTKPNPRPIVNPQPAPGPGPTLPKPIIKNPKNNKLKNLFWFTLICLSLYTYVKKESNESYNHFFSKTIHKFETTINLLKSNFINEDDFIKFKKNKKIIVTSPVWNFVTQRYESAILDNKKGDSIIIIELTKRKDADKIEVKCMLNKFDEFKLNKIDTLWVLESLLNTNLDALKSSKIESSSNSMVGVFIKYEWIENDLFTFRDEEGNKKYFTDVPQNCVLYNENGVNENNYNKKFKIKWVVDNQSYDYPINKITHIEFIK